MPERALPEGLSLVSTTYIPELPHPEGRAMFSVCGTIVIAVIVSALRK